MPHSSTRRSSEERCDGTTVWIDRVQSPLGDLITVATQDALVLLEFSDRRIPIHDTVQHQLDDYFAARRREFDVPLLVPGTPFQTLVWTELRRIPIGTTRSYAELATRVGRPDSIVHGPRSTVKPRKVEGAAVQQADASASEC